MAKRLTGKERMAADAQKAIERINKRIDGVNAAAKKKRHALQKTITEQLNVLLAERTVYKEALKLLGAEAEKTQ